MNQDKEIGTNNMQYIHVQAAATLTGISSSFLNKLRVEGGGPSYIKVGRRVLYDVADLEHWLTTKRRNNTSERP